MKFACLILSLAFAALRFAADGKSVSYKSGDETVQGMLYAPEGKGPFPALVVIHEWWGLNDWVKEQASKLADQGYVTLAVDLYRGKVATTPDEAHEIMRGVAGRPRRSRSARGGGISEIAIECEERTVSARSAGAWAADTRSMWPCRSPP